MDNTIENLMISTNSDTEQLNGIGRLGLSSCPGKKSSSSYRTNKWKISYYCLNDAELQYLGAPWKVYSEKAKYYGLEVFRLPIIEGSCPESITDVDNLMEKMMAIAKEGRNILCHCRGGVGRAGLIACCYLLKCGYTKKYSEAIKIVRAQR
ncbi:hypothetical protein LY90DRAFT_499044, partial [Neocallimastix californiae]